MKRFICSSDNQITILQDVIDCLKDTTECIDKLSEIDKAILEELTSHTFYQDLLDAQRYIQIELDNIRC